MSVGCGVARSVYDVIRLNGVSYPSQGQGVDMF
jgi:hypothetical protein